MRITQAQREATRQRIVSSARKLLSKNGFEATTTRDLASKAGIASGTFFNYFETKEALVTALVSEALIGGETSFEELCGKGQSLEEQLFSHVASGLRSLKEHRSYIHPVIERSLSPFTNDCDGSPSFRSLHLETVGRLLHAAGHTDIDGATLHLYWGLYIAVLTFWTQDDSPHQEDTLALLDRSMKLFVHSLESSATSEDTYVA